MYVARILYPVEVLGPGKRVGIWFCGCSRRCKGCSNPELWEFQERYRTTPEKIFELIQTITDSNEIDGFTITGGEPLYQLDDLQKLLTMLRIISDDIIVYTGYKKAELSEKDIECIPILIDGEYMEERNTGCILRGSDNQTIHILNENLREKYERYFKEAQNKIQNFMTSDGVVSVGIHKPGFKLELNQSIAQKGLKNVTDNNK